MAEVRIKDIDEHEIDTILAEDIDFEGHLTFKKPLMIKGKFKGEIKSTSALHIGEKAYVEAATEAAVISSKGKHKGNIVAHSRVELYSTAQVDGDIATPDFVMESGCRFNGTCNMGGSPKKDAAHQPAASASPGGPQAQAPQSQPPQSQPPSAQAHAGQANPVQAHAGQANPVQPHAAPSPSPQQQSQAPQGHGGQQGQAGGQHPQRPGTAPGGQGGQQK